ncbi:MAG: roadblock/LC7 domain-containing protein [Planctomycetota bacterium]|nr:roadblock/LC7 domain-containing protein [Planctomycetota bacterium]
MVTDSDRLRDQRLVFYREDLKQIDRVLEEFLELSGSSCNLLIDKEGHMVTCCGDAKSIDEQTIAALVAGSYATTREMAKLLGEEEFSVLFHQGKHDSIQLSMVGGRTIMATVFNDQTTIGMVRLYARKACARLEEIFDEISKRPANKATLDSDFGDSAKGALDCFFSE